MENTQNKQSKTLYFEGAGNVPRGEVENCRIRTAFTLDNGEKVYLEISGVEVTKHTAKSFQGYKNIAFIDHCFYIVGDRDEPSKFRIYRKDGRAVERQEHFEYTHENILQFVNGLGASFEKVVILPDLAGYRVHAGDGGYNYGDEFYYDTKRTAQAERIKQHFYKLEKERGAKYPCFSIWFENDVLKVRFFDGRGTLEIADVYAFDFSSK